MAGSWDRSKEAVAYGVSSLGASTQPKIGIIRSGQAI